MVFKGTESIGRRNYQAVDKAIAQMDEFINVIRAERRPGHVLKEKV